MLKGQVIIVGAGMAGLIAARELKRAGFKVMVLEANDHTGGRAYTITSVKNGMDIESGAEFIHGELPVTLELLREYGIVYHEGGGKMIRIEAGKIAERKGREKGWNKLLEKMGSVSDDMTLSNFLSTWFSGDANKELRKTAIGYASGFDLADHDQASVKRLYEEWSADHGGQYRIDKGYGAVAAALTADCLQMGCDIVLSTPVKTIEWSAGKVVTYSDNQYITDKIVVTIPLGILQNQSIENTLNFQPAIPETHAAAREIGFGAVIKLGLVFKSRFWEKFNREAGFLMGNGVIPTWWTQFPRESGLLTGWLGGPAALAWKEKSHGELVDAGLRSLQEIFRYDLAWLENELEESYVFNWPAERFVHGGYSYPMPDTPKAIELLKRPIGTKLFFAGEAIYNGPYPGTVEAALVSGMEAANKIIAG